MAAVKSAADLGSAPGRVAGGWPGAAKAVAPASTSPNATIIARSARGQAPGAGRAFTGTPRDDG